MKKCSKCYKVKEFSEFSKDKYNNDGHNSQCKSCRNEKYNDFYKNNPEKAVEKNLKQTNNRKKYYSSEEGIKSSRRSWLKKQYNLTLEEYDSMFANQNGVCAICKRPHYSDKWGVLAVDHCHNTNKIRGLLCFKCNSALGSVNDNIDILQNMINYLKYD